MEAKYLVTGGAGFIGSNIVHNLVKRKLPVRVIDNLSTGDMDNLANLRNKIHLIKGDICDLATVRMAMKGIEYVFHQAALPSVPRSIENPLASNETNINGTLNILIASRDSQAKRVIYAGSSSVYGDTPVLPKKENMPPYPLSPYALTKLVGEYYCKIFSSIYGLETIILRYFNVFGPRQDPKSQYSAVIPKFIQALLTDKTPTIYGNGEQTRDFTFVENVVYANILASQVKKTHGETINVAAGSRVDINKLLEILKEITGKNILPKYESARKGDVLHSLADISEAKRILAYTPKISLKKGLINTVRWMESNFAAQS